MVYSVDRIEQTVAVLIDEAGGRLDVPLTDLPNGTKSGDMLRQEGGVFLPDTDAAAARRARVLALQNRLRNRK